MRRLTVALAVLALGACGDTTDPGPTFTDPDDLRLAIVSGDGQVGSVQEVSALILSAAPTGVLPDTLVARIKDKSGGHASVPPNTVVNYVVPTEGCGAPWIDDATPDDSAYVETLWERPAGKLPDLDWQDVDGEQVWGAGCRLEARTVVGGAFKTDTMFTAVFTPLLPDTAWTYTHGDPLPSSFWPTADSILPLKPLRDFHRNLTWSYTVEPVGDWLAAATFGPEPALKVLREPAMGDSIGLVYHAPDGGQLFEAVARAEPVVAGSDTTWNLDIKVRPLSAIRKGSE